jgi:uncharacterized membrane protein (UPF0127 family)
VKQFACYLLLTTFCFIFAGCTKNINRVNVQIGGKSFALETARTDTERAKGLSSRKVLASNQGMIFYFDKLDYQQFWMKDTLIPLQIIFVNGCEVVDIQEMEVEKDPVNPQKLYRSSAPADKAIELSSNSVSKNLIGQKIKELCD